MKRKLHVLIQFEVCDRHRLEALDPRATRVVELRFFSGLKEKETAEVLKVSVATLKRDWEFARAWLFDQLRSSAGRRRP